MNNVIYGNWDYNPTRAQVVFLVKHDYTVGEIERLAKCPDATIWRILREHNLKAITHGQKTDKIVKPYREAGLTITEIANALNWTRGRVKTSCQRLGLNVAPTYTRTCKVCGNEFTTQVKQQITCGAKCGRKLDDRLRDRRLKNLKYKDRTITLKGVYERDRGVCYICGAPTDFNDYVLKNNKRCCRKNYPTIDHVIPIARGGSHTWDNVKLAHLSCNARKGAN